MLRYLLLIVLLAASAGPARAAETERLRYHSLTRHMGAFEDVAAAERDKVKLTVRIVAAKANGQPVSLWMTYDGQRYDLPVDDYGLVQVPRNPGIVDADPWIETNQPKGSVETKLVLLLLVPDPQRFHYADLRAATAQTDALIDKAAGLFSFFLASVKGVQFSCPPASDCTLVVHHPASDEILHPNSEGKIRLKLSPLLDAENPSIEASVPLVVVEPLTD